MKNLLIGFCIGALIILSFLLGVAFAVKDEPNYSIDLSNEYGVIINNDTIELHELEAYIYVDNI